MSTLSDLQAALAKNHNVLVLEVQHMNILAPQAAWADWAEIVAVPRNGMYSADHLNDFMLGMVPVEHTMADRFHSYGENGMSFGALYFDEVIGTAVTAGTRVITITDPYIVLPEAFEETQDIGRTDELKRRTLLRLYPDAEYGRRALRGVDIHETRQPVRKPWLFRRLIQR